MGARFSPCGRVLAAAAVACGLVGMWAGGVAAAEMAPGFKPPAVRIEKPYTNEKCLKNCHGVPGFAAEDERGVLRDLYLEQGQYALSTHGQKGLECVDCHYEADANSHPRSGYQRPDCRACHALEPPRRVFPPDALERIAEKGIKPPPDQALKAEGYLKSRHGMAWLEGNRSAPFCSDCHTAHAVRKSSDPESTVFRARLPETCGNCHRDQVSAVGVGGVLARFRIGAHGKGDLGSRYDVTECLSCHQGEGAHGEESLTGQSCPACHRVPERDAEAGLATLHVRPDSDAQPAARALGLAYGAAFWAAAAAAALLVLFLGFSALYRKPDDG